MEYERFAGRFMIKIRCKCTHDIFKLNFVWNDLILTCEKCGTNYEYVPEKYGEGSFKEVTKESLEKLDADHVEYMNQYKKETKEYSREYKRNVKKRRKDMKKNSDLLKKGKTGIKRSDNITEEEKEKCSKYLTKNQV